MNIRHLFFHGSWMLMTVIAVVLTACQTEEPTFAEQVLRNGRILTVDNEFSIAEALAIQGERIVEVGSNDDVEDQIGPDTRVIDLEGRSVIPGLIDNHMHFIRAVQRWNLQARIDGVNSKDEALAIIAAKAASMEPGEWLMVQGGWRENQFVGGPSGFTLEELDAAAPENPLFLQITYQSVYANSLALEAVGVSPDEGAYHRGPPLISGQPPYGLLNEQMPAVSQEQLEQNLFDFIHELNRVGLTSVYDVGRPPEGDISLLERMSAAGEPLPLRVWHTLKYEAYDPQGADAAVTLVRNSAPGNGDYLGLLGLGEHIYLPMFDNPGTTERYSDEIIDEFMKIATAAGEGGFQVHEHTMQDITVQSLLDEYEVLNETMPLAPLRWTLIHVFSLSTESIARARALGLTIAVHSVASLAEARVPLRDIQDGGIIWGLGTDATIVAHYQPFITLGWAVTGKNVSGNTVLDQTVSREEALIAHTRSNAYLLFKEDDLGTLEAGKFADLLVLDRDYLTVPEDEIFDIEPVLTMIGGRIAYDAIGALDAANGE